MKPTISPTNKMLNGCICPGAPTSTSTEPDAGRLPCLMELLCMRQPRSLVGLISEPAFRMSPQDIEHLMFLTRKGAGLSMQQGRWLWLPTPGLSPAGQQVKSSQVKFGAAFEGAQAELSVSGRFWPISALIDRQLWVG